jgi:hypothetical protein
MAADGGAGPRDGTTADRLCPSAEAAEGAMLLGVVGPEGRVGLLGRPLPVDAAFLETARKGRAPEKRFRFAAPCRRSECRQWGAGRCGVIDRVMAALGEVEGGAVQPCAIRADCRWHAQRGPQACRACPLVVTDTRTD